MVVHRYDQAGVAVTGVNKRGAEGQTPAQVLGTAAYRSGLLPAYQPLTPAELPALVAAKLGQRV